MDGLTYIYFSNMKDSVTVVGYPFGGDTISVTKGVVSRVEVWYIACEFLLLVCWESNFFIRDFSSQLLNKNSNQVTSYAHGSSELLGIQIDAAINPG